MPIPRLVNINSSTWTKLSAQSNCRTILVGENNQAGTTDFYYAASDSPAAGDTATYPAGKKAKFPGPHNGFWCAGDTVAYLKTATGSVDFLVEEGADQ